MRRFSVSAKAPHEHVTAGDHTTSPAQTSDHAVVGLTDITSNDRSPRVLGFRSGTTWHQMLACTFFAALYAAFVQTMFPPISASNQDVLAYKTIHLLLFATPVASVALLSDFSWCNRLPKLSSNQRRQRFSSTAILVALVFCLCANLAYLHTPDYRAAMGEHIAGFVANVQDPPSSKDAKVSDGILPENDIVPDAKNDSSRDGGESLGSAWDERHEGCDTD